MHADSAVISSTDMKIWGVKPRIGTTGSGGSVLRHAGIFLLAAAVCCCGFAPIPKESAAALGVTKGKPIMSGFVFVNGKYVKPPYLVERYGTGIRINRIQVTGQVVPWEEFLKTQPAENLVTEGDEPKAVDAESLPRQDEKDDSARRGEDTAPTAKETPVAEEKKPEVDASAEALADLFGDGPAPAKVDEAKAKAEADAKAKAEAAKAKAEEEVKAKEETKDAADEKKAKPALTLKGKFEKNSASKRLQGRINDVRTSYDKTLRRGGALFFGDGYRAFSVNDAGSAEEMIKTLAENQKKHSEAESFCNAASVYFNFKMATDLHRNRIDYRALQERLNEINEERKLMKMLKK